MTTIGGKGAMGTSVPASSFTSTLAMTFTLPPHLPGDGFVIVP